MGLLLVGIAVAVVEKRGDEVLVVLLAAAARSNPSRRSRSRSSSSSNRVTNYFYPLVSNDFRIC